MDLLGIRTLFVKLSGRFDLVVDTTNYADNGADVFIQEASKFLDRNMSTGNDEDSAFTSVGLGDFYATFASARVIKEVWIYVDDQRMKLRELPKDKVKELFPKILASTDKGIPSVYAPIRGSLKEGVAPVDFLTSAQLGSTDVNGIIFSPLDRSAIIEVVGKFYSATMSLDADENYWSIHHPMTLVWAALYLLEISYRNTSGASDWLTAVKGSLVSIEMDHVEEDSENRPQLGTFEND